VIIIRNLFKRFGNNIALDDISLHIETGEIFGLLGPNGAGKTTLINILCTYLEQDEGSVEINGVPLPGTGTILKQNIGIVPQEISLYEDMTALENLAFWGKLYGLHDPILRERADYLLQSVGLWDRRKDVVKHYSGGMKRRLNIAAGILHDPPIIFFDEPTVGIDPQSRNFIFGIIESMREANKTILYTSHYMEEVERLCTRIGIIDHGKLIALGTRLELCRLLGAEDRITMHFRESLPLEKVSQVLNLPVEMKGQNSLLLHGDKLIGRLPQILLALEKMGAELEEVNIVQPNLEQVFLALTGRELRE